MVCFRVEEINHSYIVKKTLKSWTPWWVIFCVTVLHSMKKDLKRRLSSDGKTPKPDSKSVKKGVLERKHWVDGLWSLLIIPEAVNKLQKGQQFLQSLLESKLHKFRNEFISSIDEKLKVMRSDIDLELLIHQNEI